MSSAACVFGGMSLSFWFCPQALVCFCRVTADTAASGRAALADNSVSLPGASGCANRTSSLWPHLHSAWLNFRAAFTSTCRRARISEPHRTYSQASKGTWYLIFSIAVAVSLDLERGFREEWWEMKASQASIETFNKAAKLQADLFEICTHRFGLVVFGL